MCRMNHQQSTPPPKVVPPPGVLDTLRDFGSFLLEDPVWWAGPLVGVLVLFVFLVWIGVPL